MSSAVVDGGSSTQHCADRKTLDDATGTALIDKTVRNGHSRARLGKREGAPNRRIRVGELAGCWHRAIDAHGAQIGERDFRGEVETRLALVGLICGRERVGQDNEHALEELRERISRRLQDKTVDRTHHRLKVRERRELVGLRGWIDAPDLTDMHEGSSSERQRRPADSKLSERLPRS